jgi:anaerobic selenocysteine-containing dehydrogenase
VRELLRSGADRDYLARHASGVDALERAVEPFGAELAAERSGVPAEALDALLRAVRTAGRVSVLTGTGLSMAPDANLANWFIWALHVITRSADFPGGVSFNPGFYAAPERGSAMASASTRSAGPPSRPELPSWLGEYPCSALPDEVEAGNLRALIVLGGNPALQMPDSARTDRALRQLEVLAVADIVPTETTALASHVLACADQLERADLTLIHDSLLPHVMAQYTPALVRRAPGRRPLWWVLREIGRSLERDPLPGDGAARELEDDDVLRAALASARCGLDELRRAGLEGQPVIHERSVFGWVHEHVLPGGRWQLAPPELVAQLEALPPPSPLALVPRRELRHQNSQHRALAEPAWIWLSPADAASAGVRDGEWVAVKSATGSLVGRARVTDEIRGGAISIPHGFAEPCVNRLVSALEVDPLTGMPHMSGTALALERVPCAMPSTPDPEIPCPGST